MISCPAYRHAVAYGKLRMLTRGVGGVGGGLTVLAAVLAGIGGSSSGSAVCVKHWTRPQAQVAVSQRLLLHMRSSPGDARWRSSERTRRSSDLTIR
jgi:hypothetical protein